MKLLVVEDDPIISDVLSRGLRAQSYEIDVAMDGEEGLAKALSGDHSLILLDVKLPKLNGLEVCRRIRTGGLAIPIIMLSALGTSADSDTSMELGANAYIVKPFDFDQLIACIRSLTSQTPPRQTATVIVEDLLIDLTYETVHRGGVKLEVTAHEFALLKYFAANRGNILTAEMICTYVLAMRFDSRSNLVAVLVRLLGQKIDRDRRTPLIEVMPGVGYRFAAS
jgi:two-component system copper resistance phosphate regulon response regulator CusR